MHPFKLTGLLAGLLLALALLASPAVLAQDAGTPSPEPAVQGRPAHIHAGTCATLDPNPLVPLDDVVAPSGEPAGPDAVTAVETSVTTIPLDLATFVAGDHAINVHLSYDEIETYVACGEIGGVAIDEGGTLAIGLRELNESGFAGIAFLAANADDPNQTDVSIFLAQGLTGFGLGALEDVATPAPAVGDATPDA